MSGLRTGLEVVPVLLRRSHRAGTEHVLGGVRDEVIRHDQVSGTTHRAARRLRRILRHCPASRLSTVGRTRRRPPGCTGRRLIREPGRVIGQNPSPANQREATRRPCHGPRSSLRRDPPPRQRSSRRLVCPVRSRPRSCWPLHGILSVAPKTRRSLSGRLPSPSLPVLTVVPIPNSTARAICTAALSVSLALGVDVLTIIGWLTEDGEEMNRERQAVLDRLDDLEEWRESVDGWRETTDDRLSTMDGKLATMNRQARRDHRVAGSIASTSAPVQRTRTPRWRTPGRSCVPPANRTTDA